MKKTKIPPIKQERQNAKEEKTQQPFFGSSTDFFNSQTVQKKEAPFFSSNSAPGNSSKNPLPQQLKTGVEGLSGYAMDDVTVHYNSDKPAQLQAQAYAKGSDIHLAPGQEKHLPHEAWHVAQQKQGRVKPTMQMKGNIKGNDDPALEKEADEMGAKAMNGETGAGPKYNSVPQNSDAPVLQGYFEWNKTSNDWVENGKDPVGKYFFNNEYRDNKPSPAEVQQFHAEMRRSEQLLRSTATVIPFRNCLFRVQNPNDTRRGGDPNKPSQSKVDKMNWNASQSSVDATIKDYGNAGGRNEMLWLKGAMGLAYAGIDIGLPIQMESQHGLNHQDSKVTIILPQAFVANALQTVSPSAERSREARLMLSLVGLHGQLTPEGRIWLDFPRFEAHAKSRKQFYFAGLDGRLYAIDFSQL